MLECLMNYSTSQDLACVNSQKSPSKIDAVADHDSTMDVTIKDSDVFFESDICWDTRYLFKKEATEACKREKDWAERRKCNQVEERFETINEVVHRIESPFFCWNTCSKSIPTMHTQSIEWRPGASYTKSFADSGSAACCPDYKLHQTFQRKESANVMLNSTSSLARMFNNRCNNQVSSTPTLITQNSSTPQWCSRSTPKDTPRRSVLKSHAASLVNTALLSAAHSLANPLMNTPNTTGNCRQESTRIKNLESDGDSPRSASPQSSEVDEEESIFRNGQKVHEKLSDYISEGVASASRELENEDVKRQVGRRSFSQRRKEKENQRQASMNIDMKRNPLSDHSYHQPTSIERLRRETFSESEEEIERDDSIADEEIDVVSFEKTTYVNIRQKQYDAHQLSFNFPQKEHNTRQQTLNFAQKQHSASQPTLNFARKQHDANDVALSFAQKQHNANQLAVNKPVVRRPRGRPPGPNSAKRKAAAQNSLKETYDSSPKQIARVHPYQRRQNQQKSARLRASLDERDKRELHNNMERQRRGSLKNDLDRLKFQIPEIAIKPKASKVVILNSARTYVSSLRETNDYLIKEMESLQHQNFLMQKRLEELEENKKMKQQY